MAAQRDADAARGGCAEGRLAVLHGALGDHLVALPALAALARGGPLEVWGPSAERARLLLAPRGPAAAARAFPPEALPLWGEGPLPADLRARLAGRVVAVAGEAGPVAAHVRALGGVVLPPPARAGAPGPPGHVTDALLAALAAAGVDVRGVDPRPRLAPSPADVARGRTLAGRDAYVVVHPGSGGVAKQWPAAAFAAALDLAGPAVPPAVVVTGPAEVERGLPDLAALTAGRAHLAAPALDDLLALLAGARAVLGNDAGPSHLAAALGVPVVAAFAGPADPARWAPRGRGGVRVLAGPGLAPAAVAAALGELAAAGPDAGAGPGANEGGPRP